MRLGTAITMDCCSSKQVLGRMIANTYRLFFEWLHAEWPYFERLHVEGPHFEGPHFEGSHCEGPHFEGQTARC